MRRYAGFYMNEDAGAANYDAKHKIIRSLFNGSRGPLLRKATALDWAGDPIEVASRFLDLPYLLLLDSATGATLAGEGHQLGRYSFLAADPALVVRSKGRRTEIGGPARPCNLPNEPTPDGVDWEMWNGPSPARGFNAVLCPTGIHNHFPAWRNYREYAGGGSMHPPLRGHDCDAHRGRLGE